MKKSMAGLVALCLLFSPLGCLSGADLVDGATAESDVSTDPLESASGLLGGILGDDSTGDISERDLLASLIELYAVGAAPSDSEELLLNVAASTVRDGRAGAKRAVAAYVVDQVTGSLLGAATAAP